MDRQMTETKPRGRPPKIETIQQAAQNLLKAIENADRTEHHRINARIKHPTGFVLEECQDIIKHIAKA